MKGLWSEREIGCSFERRPLWGIVCKLRLSLFLLVTLVACGSTTERISLVDQLRGRGLTVETLGDVAFPPGPGVSPRSGGALGLHMRPALQGTRLSISGENISQPFELEVYADDDERVRVGSDGKTLVVRTPNGEQIIDLADRMTPMYVFRKPPHLVVYIGNDPVVLNLLADLLGQQVAGS